MAKVLLVGYFGYANTGDEALLEVLSGRLASWGYTVGALTASPEASERDYGITPFGHKRWSELIRACRWADAVVFGGGGLLQDASGPASIWYYLGALKLAQQLKKPVALYAQGIGPLRGPFSGKAIRRLASGVGLLSVRDEGSRQLLVQLGAPEQKVELAACPTLLLEPADDARLDALIAEEALPTDLPWLGVSLRATPAVEAAAGELAEGLRRVAEQGLARPLLIPFQPSQDEALSWKVRGELGSLGALVKGSWRPSELLGLIGRCKAVLATRLHALLFAANREAPALAIDYDPKVRAAALALGVPVLKPAEVEGFELRDRLRALLAEGVTTELCTGCTRLRSTAEAGLERLREFLADSNK
jgi:polysaccharide pyruvyl transferase CsaB